MDGPVSRHLLASLAVMISYPRAMGECRDIKTPPRVVGSVSRGNETGKIFLPPIFSGRRTFRPNIKRSKSPHRNAAENMCSSNAHRGGDASEKSPSAQTSAPKQTKNVHPIKAEPWWAIHRIRPEGSRRTRQGVQTGSGRGIGILFYFENPWPKVGDGDTTGGPQQGEQ